MERSCLLSGPTYAVPGRVLYTGSVTQGFGVETTASGHCSAGKMRYNDVRPRESGILKNM